MVCPAADYELLTLYTGRCRSAALGLGAGAWNEAVWRLPPKARTVMSSTERKELGRIFDLWRIKGALRLVPVGGVPGTCEVFEVCEAFHGLALAILSRRTSHRRSHRALRFTMTVVPGCLLALLPPPSPGRRTLPQCICLLLLHVSRPRLGTLCSSMTVSSRCTPTGLLPTLTGSLPTPTGRYPYNHWFVTHTHWSVTIHSLIRYPHPLIRYSTPTDSLPHSLWFVTHTHWFVTTHPHPLVHYYTPLVRYLTPTGSLPHTHWFVTTPTGSLPHTHWFDTHTHWFVSAQPRVRYRTLTN